MSIYLSPVQIELITRRKKVSEITRYLKEYKKENNIKEGVCMNCFRKTGQSYYSSSETALFCKENSKETYPLFKCAYEFLKRHPEILVEWMTE